jgi:hypothetical protein
MSDERRAQQRHDLQLPIRLGNTTLGRTIDISGSGVRFLCDRDVAPGSPIEFDVELDALWSKESVHCFGRVVRAGRIGESSYLAATIDDIQFGTN